MDANVQAMLDYGQMTPEELFWHGMRVGFRQTLSPVCITGRLRKHQANASKLGVLAASVGMPRAEVERLGLVWPKGAESPWWLVGRHLCGVRVARSIRRAQLAQETGLWLRVVEHVEERGVSLTPQEFTAWLAACEATDDETDRIFGLYMGARDTAEPRPMWTPSGHKTTTIEAQANWDCMPQTAASYLVELGYIRGQRRGSWVQRAA